MKITVCGSISFAKQMRKVVTILTERGHAVLLPDRVAQDEDLHIGDEEAANRKEEFDLIKKHWEKIRECDAILVLNYHKNGIEGYVGGNTFLEMGFAHVLGKPIYLLYDIPPAPYRAEMLAMRPTVLKGNLDVL